MDKALSIIKTAAENEKKGIAVCAKVLYEHGITLSEAETAAIVAAHTKALRDSGRVEFGEGALPALTKACIIAVYNARKLCRAFVGTSGNVLFLPQRMRRAYIR